MISAGSGIPNNGGRCDLPGARATSWSRHWVIISSALALLPCLLQGCGNSDTKALAKRDPAMPSPASSKGDILVPSAFRTAEAGQPAVRDTFADRVCRGFILGSVFCRYWLQASARDGQHPHQSVAGRLLQGGVTVPGAAVCGSTGHQAGADQFDRLRELGFPVFRQEPTQRQRSIRPGHPIRR